MSGKVDQRIAGISSPQESDYIDGEQNMYGVHTSEGADDLAGMLELGEGPEQLLGGAVADFSGLDFSQVEALTVTETDQDAIPTSCQQDKADSEPAKGRNHESGFRQHDRIPGGRLSKSEQDRLVARAQQGDKHALETLWVDSRGVAKYVSYLVKGDFATPDDKIQICLLEVPGVVKGHDLAGEASLNTRLYRRMYGALIDEFRRYHRILNGLSRKQLASLIMAKNMMARDSDFALNDLHELTQPQESKGNRKSEPYFVNAGAFIVGGQVNMAPVHVEALVSAGEGGDDYESPKVLAEQEDTTSVFELVVKSMNDRKFAECVAQLPARQRDVLIRYNGLFGCTPMTQEELGAEYGVTNSRISQINTQAMQHLGLMYRQSII